MVQVRDGCTSLRGHRQRLERYVQMSRCREAVGDCRCVECVSSQLAVVLRSCVHWGMVGTCGPRALATIRLPRRHPMVRHCEARVVLLAPADVGRWLWVRATLASMPHQGEQVVGLVIWWLTPAAPWFARNAGRWHVLLLCCCGLLRRQCLVNFPLRVASGHRAMYQYRFVGESASEGKSGCGCGSSAGVNAVFTCQATQQYDSQ
jgi:hypothetical protein